MLKSHRYALKDRKVVACPDMREWAFMLADEDACRVALTMIDNIEVSTVFIGIDMGLGRSKQPQVFETMIFEDGKAKDNRRYATWEEAEAGHREIVAAVTAKRAEPRQ